MEVASTAAKKEVEGFVALVLMDTCSHTTVEHVLVCVLITLIISLFQYVGVCPNNIILISRVGMCRNNIILFQLQWLWSHSIIGHKPHCLKIFCTIEARVCLIPSSIPSCSHQYWHEGKLCRNYSSNQTTC